MEPVGKNPTARVKQIVIHFDYREHKQGHASLVVELHGLLDLLHIS
jgi:hypothetical protein